MRPLRGKADKRGIKGTFGHSEVIYKGLISVMLALCVLQIGFDGIHPAVFLRATIAAKLLLLPCSRSTVK